MAMAPEDLKRSQPKAAPKKAAPAPKRSAPAPAPVEAPSSVQVAQKWPSYAWALNIPGLRDILSDPSITSADQLQAKIEQTDWWRNTQPAIRNWQIRQQQDPAGASQDRQQKEADIWDMYLGVGLKPDVPAVQDLALQALKMGWNDSQLKDAIVGHMQYSPDIMNQVGSVQTSANNFKQLAAEYYVPIDDQTAFGWGKSVAAGEHSMEDFTPQIQQWAKSKFGYSPEIVKAIDSGTTVKQFLSPWQQTAAQLLETSPDAIDLTSQKWNQALDHVDPSTNEHRLMTLNEFGTFVRNQDEWKGTRQAQQQAADMAETLTKTFGKTA